MVHRYVLEGENLIAAPQDPPRDGDKVPLPELMERPDDGYGTDRYNPNAGAEGCPIGRNMSPVPKKDRRHKDAPDVQMISQLLLAREEFKPAGAQLNVIAAAWIQAMVHDWIGYFEAGPDSLDKGEGDWGKCPMTKFKFKETKEREDGFFNSTRTQWWDASFVYGNNKAMVDRTRTFKDGKLIIVEDRDHLPTKDGVFTHGDNKNGWVGVNLLQEIFVKEHNYVADKIKAENPNMSDQEIFGACRLVIAALVAKIHTVDWTLELLKTYYMKVGMLTNWYGLTKAMSNFWLPGYPLRLIMKEKADNKGVPFSLSEEFAAVYRLHPLMPPGLIIGENKDEFIRLEDLLTQKGVEALTKTKERPVQFWESVLYYPCGHLVPNNYPDALRSCFPTDEDGRDLAEEDKIDLAALDLFRDRERGIQTFNEFRRQLHLKPYKTWEALVGKGNEEQARKLEAVYGPAPRGIENLDLLVGDLYEEKLPGFAISETSFIVFLLMASRRLDADPFLNEYMTAKYYTKYGLKHVESVMGMTDLLNRHYPKLAAPFLKKKQSAFKPLGTQDDWKDAIAKGVVPDAITNHWKDVKERNAQTFKSQSDSLYTSLV